MQAAIEARAVSHRTRRGEVAVRDVSLTVGHGELVGIIGGRGSGKTTLLDALSGLRPPTTGTVLRCPAGLFSSNGRPRTGHVGYVPDADAIHPILPLSRALRYSAALRGVRVSDAARDEALRAVGLAGAATVPVGELNPGERKRAAIAAELLARPAQLFLDEPTAALDPAQAAEVVRLLRRLSEQGTTVVLTTSSPLDAARCDKVAVLATGGHLAFFGTPAAARGYFGADSLEEIYERLAGLGDPAAAWSRRFFQLSRTRASLTPPPTTPRAPGPAVLVPDVAGPHSAGHPGPLGASPAADLVPAARNGQADALAAGVLDVRGRADRAGDTSAPKRAGGFLRPARQLPVLIRRNVEVLARSPLARARLAAVPVAVLLAFALVIGAGAADTAAASLAWVALGGFGIGLAYGLPQVSDELGMLRAERFAGLSVPAYILAKLAALLPALAAADAIALLVPAACSRLPHGYGPAYLTLLLSSVAACALALLLSAAFPGRANPTSVVGALWLPALLIAGAVLALLDRPTWPDWLGLAALSVALTIALIVVIDRRIPTARRTQ